MIKFACSLIWLQERDTRTAAAAVYIVPSHSFFIGSLDCLACTNGRRCTKSLRNSAFLYMLNQNITLASTACFTRRRQSPSLGLPCVGECSTCSHTIHEASHPHDTVCTHLTTRLIHVNGIKFALNWTAGGATVKLPTELPARNVQLLGSARRRRATATRKLSGAAD